MVHLLLELGTDLRRALTQPWKSAQWLLPCRKSFLDFFVKTDLEPFSDLILGFQLYSSVAFVRLDGLQWLTLKAC